MAVENRKCK